MTEPQSAPSSERTRPLDPPPTGSWDGPTVASSSAAGGAPSRAEQPPSGSGPAASTDAASTADKASTGQASSGQVSSGETSSGQAPTDKESPDKASPEASSGTSPEASGASGGSVPLGAAGSAARTGDAGAVSRPAPGRGPSPRVPRPASTSTSPGKQRRARLRLHRIDPWSVFVLSLLVSLFLAVVLVVAAAALYAVLDAAGVPASVNQLVGEVTRSPGAADPAPLLTAGRVLTTSLVIAVVDVVLLTALATLGAVLYNLCASFSGGIEVTLAED